jgi:hypothetical protein
MQLLQLYSNQLIGYNPHFKYEIFSGTDTEELYKKNLKNNPIDWYYRDVNITYERNSCGHRCKEIEEVDFDNYILAVGCSFTEGVGLEVDKTYVSVLAEILKCDYYNLGVGGSGIDVMFHNLFVWLASQPKKPKLIIVQWPSAERFSHLLNNNINTPIDQSVLLQTVSPNTNYPGAKEMLLFGDNINFFKTVELLTKVKIEHIKKLFDVPLIEISLKNPPNFKDDSLIPFEPRDKKIDFARDQVGDTCNGHYGNTTHLNLAKRLVIELYKKYNF